MNWLILYSWAPLALLNDWMQLTKLPDELLVIAVTAACEWNFIPIKNKNKTEGFRSFKWLANSDVYASILTFMLWYFYNVLLSYMLALPFFGSIVVLVDVCTGVCIYFSQFFSFTAPLSPFCNGKLITDDNLNCSGFLWTSADNSSAVSINRANLFSALLREHSRRL